MVQRKPYIMLSPVVAPAQTSRFREVEVLRSKRDWHAFWGVFVELNQEDVAPCTVVPNEGAGSHAIDLYVHPRRRPIGASLGLRPLCDVSPQDHVDEKQ